MRDVVEEVDGGWRIPLEGFVATGVQGTGNTYLRLELDDREAFINVPLEMAPEIEALAAARAVVTTANVSGDTMLTVEFEGQPPLSIPAIPDYENWEVEGPGRIHVVGTPAGGPPAIWDATSRAIPFKAADLPLVLHDILDSIETQEGDPE